MSRANVPGRFWLAYPAWALACGLLFFTVRDVEDDSRARDRVEAVAIRRAVMTLHQVDRRFAGYTAVHTSFARGKVDGSPDRWIVLCDSPTRSGLRNSVVVEVTADGTRVLRVRKPEM
ncbi:MAG TPA: hypothetical protein VNM92_18345 [Thermoanaerobaculia bacterium]|nr:hypothetical protein [Thermoanaerobaculia bacterium]